MEYCVIEVYACKQGVFGVDDRNFIPLLERNLFIVVYILLLLLIYAHQVHAIAIEPGLSKKISNCHGKCDECHTL